MGYFVREKVVDALIASKTIRVNGREHLILKTYPSKLANFSFKILFRGGAIGVEEIQIKIKDPRWKGPCIFDSKFFLLSVTLHLLALSLFALVFTSSRLCWRRWTAFDSF
jgi:hypothetical protein